MRTIQTIAMLASLLFPITATSQNGQTPNANHRIEPLPRDLEIQLALSALPPHLRDKATVYVLNPDKGFDVARRGSDAFHAFVARTGDDTFRGSWPLKEYRHDILYPIAFDRAGVNAQMRVFFDAAEMQAKGTPPEALKRIVQERYRTRYYTAPQRAGVAYMLAPVLRTYDNPDENETASTLSIPHVMHYAPNVSNEDVGGGTIEPGATYPFVILNGPHGYHVQFLGRTESATIQREYQAMLARLCQIKDEWCLPARRPKVGAD